MPGPDDDVQKAADEMREELIGIGKEAFGPDKRRTKALEETLQEKLGHVERRLVYDIDDDPEERKKLHRSRYLRAQEIVEWISKMWAHQMEPPAVELYLDGSGSFHLGKETLESMGDHGREQLEDLVGSSRWGTDRRMGGGLRYSLTFCHLRLDTEVGK